MTLRTSALLLLLVAGCAQPTDTTDADTDTDTDPAEPTLVADVAPRDAGWLRGDLHVHTNFSDDAAEQGGDDLGPALAIADAWRHPGWVAARPELAEQYLDFVAITDHRTTAPQSDPAWQHEHLVLVGGEEFGSDGHAGAWGIRTHVPHEPKGAETPNQRLIDAIDEVHAQGGLFSINHPLYEGDLWGWDAPGFDAIEVWNAAWSTLASEVDEAMLDAWVAGHGVENAAVRVAARAGGGGRNGQAVRFWQAWLSRGVHVPPVGGGDRHMVFPTGLPTTYVLATGPDEAGVLAGLAAGHTFVSRSPHGPQVVLTATVDGETHAMGSALPGATDVEVGWRVARAAGGRLRLLAGVVDPAMPDPAIVLDVALDGDLAEGTFAWSPPAGGGWLHAVVVDPLPSAYPSELQGVADGFMTFPASSSFVGILSAMGPLIDLDELGSPSVCTPDRWVEWELWCMPADAEPMGTFYIPDPIARWMSTEFEAREPTGYAMGAISAAFHTAPATP